MSFSHDNVDRIIKVCQIDIGRRENLYCSRNRVRGPTDSIHDHGKRPHIATHSSYHRPEERAGGVSAKFEQPRRSAVMTSVECWWAFCRHGYKIATLGGEVGSTLIPVNGRVGYVDRAQFPRLFQDYLDAKTESAAVQFCNQYGVPIRGMIGWDDPIDARLYARIMNAMPLSQFNAKRIALEKEISALRSWRAQGDGYYDFPAFDSLQSRHCIEWGPDRPQEVRRPASLYDLMLFQAFQHYSGMGSAARTCPQCRRLFVAGPNTGKRSDATFCTRQCGDAYYNGKRKGRVQSHRTNK